MITPRRGSGWDVQWLSKKSFGLSTEADQERARDVLFTRGFLDGKETTTIDEDMINSVINWASDLKVVKNDGFRLTRMTVGSDQAAARLAALLESEHTAIYGPNILPASKQLVMSIDELRDESNAHLASAPTLAASAKCSCLPLSAPLHWTSGTILNPGLTPGARGRATPTVRRTSPGSRSLTPSASCIAIGRT